MNNEQYNYSLMNQPAGLGESEHFSLNFFGQVGIPT